MSDDKGGVLDHRTGFGDLLTEEQLDTICILRRVWRTGLQIDKSIQGLINVDCLKGIRRKEESGPMVILLLTLMFERGAVPRSLFPRMLHVLATYLPGATPQSTTPPFYHEKHESLVELFLKMYEEAEFPQDMMGIVESALRRVPDEKAQVKYKLLQEAKRQAKDDDQLLNGSNPMGTVTVRMKSTNVSNYPIQGKHASIIAFDEANIERNDLEHYKAIFQHLDSKINATDQALTRLKLREDAQHNPDGTMDITTTERVFPGKPSPF